MMHRAASTTCACLPAGKDLEKRVWVNNIERKARDVSDKLEGRGDTENDRDSAETEKEAKIQ